MEAKRDAETTTLGRTFICNAEKGNAFSKLSHYETGIKRSLYKALHELQRLQAAKDTRMTVARQLDNDQVTRLIHAYREKGDRRALERIFAMHGKILIHIVRRYSISSDEPYEDLLQVGYVGLIKAENDHKVDPVAKFSSYAYARIDSELRHYFRDTALVRNPGGRGACTRRSPSRPRASPASSAAHRLSRRSPAT
jgi:DNA-directed RNA polymerase sigma subunit (sigma70/sigma32)